MKARSIKLVRDVLDTQLVDREGYPLGRVDGIVLTIESPTQPPRVARIEVGPVTLARRLHPTLGRWCRAIARRWGIRRGQPVRIPWSRILSIGKDIKLDVTAGNSALLAWERWLADHVIERIPGGDRKQP